VHVPYLLLLLLSKRLPSTNWRFCTILDNFRTWNLISIFF
jgi:hypothetical protein